MRRPVGSLFLDVDRVTSVFSLLFAFVRDDLCEESPTYESAMTELFRGLKLPDGIDRRLRTIFARQMDEPCSFEELLDGVMRDFAEDRGMLPVILELLLRVSADDGMVSRTDAERLRVVLNKFKLDEEEIDSLPEEDQSIVEAILYGSRRAGETLERSSARVLAGHYELLGCRPDATDAEVRRLYRSLVMKYHPDKAASAPQGDETKRDETKRAMRRKFEAVQGAYEAIKRSRGK